MRNASGCGSITGKLELQQPLDSSVDVTASVSQSAVDNRSAIGVELRAAGPRESALCGLDEPQAPVLGEGLSSLSAVALPRELGDGAAVPHVPPAPDRGERQGDEEHGADGRDREVDIHGITSSPARSSRGSPSRG